MSESPAMTKGELVERLHHLVSLNEPSKGGPYQGTAAQECVKAMSEAATALSEQAARIEALELELDAVKAFGVGFYAPNVEEATREAYRSIACRSRTTAPGEGA